MLSVQFAHKCVLYALYHDGYDGFRLLFAASSSRACVNRFVAVHRRDHGSGTVCVVPLFSGLGRNA